MSRKRATLTDLLNELTARVLFDKFKLLAVNQFEWGNLGIDLETRHVENILFDKGHAGYFRATDGDFMCLPVRATGKVNVNGDPLEYVAYGNGFQQTLRADDIVIIENNLLRIPTRDFVLFYVNKLAEIERTMDVNIKACKTPIVFACDDKDVLSVKRVFQQVDGNVPAIFADRNLNLDSVQVFDTKAKFMGIELRDLEHAIEGDLLTFLGQNNVSVEKKERLITDEANANNQLIESFFDLQLEARERACEQIREKFGVNVTVKPRQPVQKAVETVETGEGGNEE